MPKTTNRWIKHPNAGHDDAPDYELHDEFCHEGTKIWLDFQHYIRTAHGNLQPGYSITIVNRATGAKAFETHTDERRLGQKAIYTTQVAKQHGLRLAKSPSALDSVGISLCQDE